MLRSIRPGPQLAHDVENPAHRRVVDSADEWPERGRPCAPRKEVHPLSLLRALHNLDSHLSGFMNREVTRLKWRPLGLPREASRRCQKTG
jgi:hypothetical protein